MIKKIICLFCRKTEKGFFCCFSLILLFALILFNSCNKSINQNSAGLEKTKDPFANHLITEKGIIGLEIGTPFRKVKKDFKDFKFRYYPDYWGYSMINEKLNYHLFLTVLDNKVSGLTTSDERFCTKNGICVNSNLIEFKEKYPSLKIRYNHHDQIELFSLDYANTTIQFEVKPNKEENVLGLYKAEIYDSSSDYRMEGKIAIISVFLK